MSIDHSGSCVMTNTDQFFVRVCRCGVVHISFGFSVVNVSYEAAVAIGETFKQVASEVRMRIAPASVPEHSAAGILPQNVIQGPFPSSKS